MLKKVSISIAALSVTGIYINAKIQDTLDYLEPIQTYITHLYKTASNALINTTNLNTLSIHSPLNSREYSPLLHLTKQLIEIRSILNSIQDKNNHLDLPAIVVIGSQSSGKSSVLEAIVGHEFLPKGSNMVTRRPIELTLIHSDSPSDLEYGEFPTLGLGKIYKFNQIQKTLYDLNKSVPATEYVSDIPIQLNIYSPNVPDLSLVDLPGYIQISNKDQPKILKEKIISLCDSYISKNNIILAVCAADVDLANSEALSASRKVDPLGVRTIGVVTKMDLVDPLVAAKILTNQDYPLKLGYIGVICTSSSNESKYFHAHQEIFKDCKTGTNVLCERLSSLLEKNMTDSMGSISKAVHSELLQTQYQLKVSFNDAAWTAESYKQEIIEQLKTNFRNSLENLDKNVVKKAIHDMLLGRVSEICLETLWRENQNVIHLDELVSQLTKSGIGKSSVDVACKIVMDEIQNLLHEEPWKFHLNSQMHVLNQTKLLLQEKTIKTQDMIENMIKPFKSRIDYSQIDWKLGQQLAHEILKNTIEIKKQELDAIKKEFKNSKRRLRNCMRNLMNGNEHECPLEVLEYAKQAVAIESDIETLNKRKLMLGRLWTPEDAPEVYMCLISHHLTFTSMLFLDHELMEYFSRMFPRRLQDCFEGFEIEAQENPEIEMQEIGKSEARNTRDVLKQYSCYDIIPESTKVVVFDVELNITKAITAMLSHEIDYAPLYNSDTQEFAGLFTVTDFIRLILYLENTCSSYDDALQQLQQMPISKLSKLAFKQCAPDQPISTSPLASLADAVQLLLDYELHRLPLIDTLNNSEIILNVLTPSKILRFISANCSRTSNMQKSIYELQLGTFENVETFCETTKLKIVLEGFLSRNISAFPIVNSQNKVLDVYEKYDVFSLTTIGPLFDLEISIGEALSYRSSDFKGIHTCSKNDSLCMILDTLQSAWVHRFIILNDDETLAGILTLQDILTFIVK